MWRSGTIINSFVGWKREEIKMNITEMTKTFRDQKTENLTLEDCDIIVNGVLDVMRNGLIQTGKLCLSDLFTIEIVPQRRTRWKNIHTGEKFELEQRQRLRIKPGKELKNLLEKNECKLT